MPLTSLATALMTSSPARPTVFHRDRKPPEISDTLYAWKRMSDGEIAQGHTAPSADELFEAAGFGAVGTDKPIKGYLAVRVEQVNGVLVEATQSPQSRG